jgi:hypothetical protein
MISIAAIAAAAVLTGTAPVTTEQLNITKTYTRVQIQVWSETVDEKAVATTWCLAKGHGHAVVTAYVGLRKFGNQPGGKAYYQTITCLMVPLQA